MYDPYQALYIHIPFCVKRCRYCDFTTQAVDVCDPSIDAYIEDICLQLRRSAKAGELASVETIYVGGGTPSFVGLSRLSMLFYTLGLSLRLEPDVECTMEANLESLTSAMVKDLWALGVNRLSLGVQSFDDKVLSILGRAHDAACARKAVEMAHERFENVSVDLMCGIPGQSEESLAESIRTAIDLGVTHVSVYPLTIEPETPFEALVNAGNMDEPDDDVAASHMELAARMLRKNGYERYEVASYAKPGFACRHNIAYWTAKPYLGLGASAVTMTQNARERLRLQDGQVVERLDHRQMVAEDLMLGMRMSRGVSESSIDGAQAIIPEVSAVFQQLEADGLVAHQGGRYIPTELGWLCGNELYGRLYGLAP